jgi:NAD-dependent deacetylase
MADPNPSLLAQARDSLAQAERLLVVTGAGISAESGVPTFRGSGGLWEGHRAEDLASPEAFQRAPETIWRWYRWRRGLCNDAQPNPGHRAIAALEERLSAEAGWTPAQSLELSPFLLATQNVDGLHPRAGSQAIVELHGCIDKSRCTGCGEIRPLAEDPHSPQTPCPACARCGAMLRPHILWFGESYWPGMLELCTHLADRATVCLVVGTSGMVWPPIALALRAKSAGAMLIDVNPNPSQVTDHADLWLQGPSGVLLPKLLGD